METKKKKKGKIISPFNNSETPEDITFIYAFMFTSYMCLYPVGKLPNKTVPSL